MKNTASGLFFRLKRAIFNRSKMLETIEESLKTLESRSRSTDERTITLESLMYIADERSLTYENIFRKIDAQIGKLESLVRAEAEQSLTTAYLISTIEQRSATLESLLNIADERTRAVENLVRITEQRSNTLEFIARQTLYSINYQTEHLQKIYVEIAPFILALEDRECFNAASFIALQTDFPIALNSNDHIEPDSTIEGVSRPTFFVRECMRVLGSDFKALDLGTGAAGLIFEWAMNGVMAVGVDGSNFCRNNKIGYWPVLKNNLFTCDITRPFQFVSLQEKDRLMFRIITAWEVLEHILEIDLSMLLENVCSHLHDNGYFVGSISFVEYVGKDGIPYHVTLKSKTWWRKKFSEYGLTMLAQHPFDEHVFYRGNGPKFQDFHNYFNNPEDGFHFVAQKST